MPAIVQARISLALFALLTFVSTSAAAGPENWPRFRGADGTGLCDGADLPTEWSAEQIRWRTALPGLGQSSPVYWGDKLFLTAAENEGQKRSVLCLNRESGEVLWQTIVWEGSSAERIHKMNSWASATCAVDGEHVAAFFGNGGGLVCLDFEGNIVWRRDLGSFEMGDWGTAASPVFVGKAVVQNCDSDNNSFLIALDKSSGEQLWKTPRDKVRGWSTPLVVEAAAADGPRTELVMNGDTGVKGYDPETGRELWFYEGSTGRGESSLAVTKSGWLFTVNGRPGDIYTVKPGGEGTVTKTHEAWRTVRKTGRDLPSPIVVGDYALVVSMQGIASCYEAESGKELWKERVPGNFSASPIAAGGLVYIPNEAGETFVLRLGPKFEVVAHNSLGSRGDEIFRASPAPGEGCLYLRSDSALYCIGKGSAE